MAEPVSISPLIGSVTGLYDSPLVKKFNNLGVLINTIGSTGTHEIKEIAARLELWGKDICGNSKTEDKIPSQVLQVLQEAFPDSALVKTIENNLDKIISVVERLADDSSDHSSSFNEYLQSFYQLSDCVKEIRAYYAFATDMEPIHKVILSLDGGGIRSLSSLLILNALMDKVHKVEVERGLSGDLKTTANVREYFDYFFGTGSGGLVSVMLGRLRMDVSESIDAFRKYSSRVFDQPRRFPPLRALFLDSGPKYKAKNLTAAIEALDVKKLDKSQPWTSDIYASKSDPCRTCVMAFRKNLQTGTENLHMFRTYDHDRDNPGGIISPGPAAREAIRDIARATSATESYFPPITIGDSVYQDASLGCNNPSRVAVFEVMEMAKKELEERKRRRNRRSSKEIVESEKIESETGDKSKGYETRQSPTSESFLQQRAVTVLVSIGAGKRREATRFIHGSSISSLEQRLQMITNIATDSDAVHSNMEHFCELSGIRYFRFNVDNGLQDIDMDEWSGSGNNTTQTLEEITRATISYLSKSDIQKSLAEAAAALISYRHPRVPPPIIPLQRYKRVRDGQDLEYQKLMLIKHIVNANLTEAKNKLKAIRRNEDRHNELPHLREVIPKLEVEYNIVDWVCQIYAITHNKTDTISERQAEAENLWDKIGLEYHQISVELKKVLEHRLELLRLELGYKDIVNPWGAGLNSLGGQEWFSKVDYTMLDRQ